MAWIGCFIVIIVVIFIIVVIIVWWKSPQYRPNRVVDDGDPSEMVYSPIMPLPPTPAPTASFVTRTLTPPKIDRGDIICIMFMAPVRPRMWNYGRLRRPMISVLRYMCVTEPPNSIRTLLLHAPSKYISIACDDFEWATSPHIDLLHHSQLPRSPENAARELDKLARVIPVQTNINGVFVPPIQTEEKDVENLWTEERDHAIVVHDDILHLPDFVYTENLMINRELKEARRWEHISSRAVHQHIMTTLTTIGSMGEWSPKEITGLVKDYLDPLDFFQDRAWRFSM